MNIGTIALDSLAATALREWLVDNYTLANTHGCDDRLLGLFLADAENDADGLIEIKARDSVTGHTVTYRVQP